MLLLPRSLAEAAPKLQRSAAEQTSGVSRCTGKGRGGGGVQRVQGDAAQASEARTGRGWADYLGLSRPLHADYLGLSRIIGVSAWRPVHLGAATPPCGRRRRRAYARPRLVLPGRAVRCWSRRSGRAGMPGARSMATFAGRQGPAEPTWAAGGAGAWDLCDQDRKLRASCSPPSLTSADLASANAGASQHGLAPAR